MVDNIPDVGAWHVDHRIVTCGVDVQIRVLGEHHSAVFHIGSLGGRRGDGIAHAVVGTAGVALTPHEVVASLALEDVGSLLI